MKFYIFSIVSNTEWMQHKISNLCKILLGSQHKTCALNSSGGDLDSTSWKGIITSYSVHLRDSCSRYTSVSPNYLLWNHYITTAFWNQGFSVPRESARTLLVKPKWADLVQGDSGVGFVLDHNPVTYITTWMFCDFRGCYEVRSFVPLRNKFVPKRNVSFEIRYIFLGVRIHNCSRWLQKCYDGLWGYFQKSYHMIVFNHKNL